jgi:hypothetical protein
MIYSRISGEPPLAGDQAKLTQPPFNDGRKVKPDDFH